MAAIIADIIVSGIIGATSKWIENAIGPETPGCTFDSDYTDNWWQRAYYTADDGNNYTVADICWSAGGYQITQGDSDVVTCTMGLHVNQATTCIDVEGSACDTVPGTGVGNVRNIYNLDTSNDQQIDQFSAERTATAFYHIIANEKGWELGSYMSIYPMNDDGTYTSWSIQVRGTGADDC